MQNILHVYATDHTHQTNVHCLGMNKKNTHEHVQIWLVEIVYLGMKMEWKLQRTNVAPCFLVYITKVRRLPKEPQRGVTPPPLHYVSLAKGQQQLPMLVAEAFYQ